MREVPAAVALRSTDDTTNGSRPPARPTVAAFDFDGTLTDGGSAFPFLVIVRGLLPVLRNTVAGIQSVDPSAVDAARGMGMTRWQALMRVQLPLASPLVFAGLRTSLVLIIGTATLGNFIGGGGLGDVIAAGINTSDRMVFVGAVMVASLALLADWGLSMIERVAVPKQVAR